MEPKKIMVIDDDPDIAVFVTTLLEENGFQTCSAENGAEGQKRLRQEKPDLICLDLLMPEKTGILLYREIRKDPELRGIPVVMITGFAAPEHPMIDFKRFIASRSIPPPEAFLEKPVDRELLLRTVQELLSVPRRG